MPGRILIVDDVAANRVTLRAKLAAYYYDVIEATDGESALAVAEREQPDLILLDVMMPGIDGFETCQRLKDAPATMHIPVVLLTALHEQSDRLRGLEAGADDFLTKPCEDMALAVRVASLIRMKLMVDELRLRDDTSRLLGLDRMHAADAGPDLAAASVLVVARRDDAIAGMLDGIHAALGCAVDLAEGEAAARALVAANRYDACVVGTALAGSEPLRLASRLRARPETRRIPVLMVFPPGQLPRAHLALEMGIADYLIHPPDQAELAARLKIQLRRKHYADRLRSAMEESLVMAATDPLTGLYNRRYARSQLEAHIARQTPDGLGLAAMTLDLDRFKAVNDAYGHPAGDEVLREFARRLREGVRATDLVSRIGGEEFLVVMPDIAPEHAESVAERIRAAAESARFQLGGSDSVRVTASIGLALHRTGDSADDLLARADAALYASKRAGRNMVTFTAAA